MKNKSTNNINRSKDKNVEENVDKTFYNSFIEFLQKNHGWILAIFSVVGFCILLFNYLMLKTRFFLFNLNFDLINSSTYGIIFNFILTIFSSLLVIYASFCKYQNDNDFVSSEEKNFNRVFLIITCIFMAFYLDIFYIDVSLNVVSIIIFILCNLISVFFLYLFIILLKNIFSPIYKEIYFSNNENMERIMLLVSYCFKLFFWAFCTSIVFLFICDLYLIKQDKEFYLINSETVIVYTTEEYYLTLDCRVEKEVDGKEKITIYKNTQNKISTDNVKTYKKKFSKVNLVNKIFEIEDSLEDRVS